MRRRSFLFATASLPLLGSVPPYFPAPSVPKIINLSVSTQFQLTPIFTSGLLAAYDPDPPPEIKLMAEYDDGSIRHFECSKCAWSDLLGEGYSNSKCDIVGNDMVVDMSYAIKGTNETKVARCIYRDIKEVFDGVRS